MNSDFAAYIDNLKKQIKSFDANLTITEKKLQYGIQLTVTNSDSKVVLSVYNGKKGIKFVWGGTASELRSQLEAVLKEKILPIKGISYRLLEMTIHFYEIVPILKVFGQAVTNQVKEIFSDP